MSLLVRGSVGDVPLGSESRSGQFRRARELKCERDRPTLRRARVARFLLLLLRPESGGRDPPEREWSGPEAKKSDAKGPLREPRKGRISAVSQGVLQDYDNPEVPLPQVSRGL